MLHKPLLVLFCVVVSLRASSPGHSGSRAGKGRRACNYCASLEFEYLHRKSRCEMLIGKDSDFSNDVITLNTCFTMLVYIRDHFRFTLIGGNLTAQSTGSYKGNGDGIQSPKT